MDVPTDAYVAMRLKKSGVAEDKTLVDNIVKHVGEKMASSDIPSTSEIFRGIVMATMVNEACQHVKVYGSEKAAKLDESYNDMFIEESMRQNKAIAVEPNCGVVCKKCGKQTVHFEQFQTSSADEAPTNFYRCLSCEDLWRSR